MKALLSFLIKYKTSAYVVNGKHPERVMSILNGQSTVTRLSEEIKWKK
jgi:aspartokinase-like uncharacterized kinase